MFLLFLLFVYIGSAKGRRRNWRARIQYGDLCLVSKPFSIGMCSYYSAYACTQPFSNIKRTPSSTFSCTFLNTVFPSKSRVNVLDFLLKAALGRFPRRKDSNNEQHQEMIRKDEPFGPSYACSFAFSVTRSLFEWKWSQRGICRGRDCNVQNGSTRFALPLSCTKSHTDQTRRFTLLVGSGVTCSFHSKRILPSILNLYLFFWNHSMLSNHKMNIVIRWEQSSVSHSMSFSVEQNFCFSWIDRDVVRVSS